MRNSPIHFTTGVGVYSPWAKLDAHVKTALTAQAPKRACEWKRGYWKEGRFVEDKPKAKDNRRVRVRGPKPRPVKSLYWHIEKGWQEIPL